jgi:hypothetical protein
LHPLPREITDSTLLWRQDGPCWEYPQAQQVSQVTCIGLISAVLQSVVFFDRRRIGEMHLEARFLQPVDKPVPIERPMEIFL